MEISLLALVGIGLATMFFGYFFGLFEGRAQGYKRRKKEEPLDLERTLLPANARASATVDETARAGSPRPNSLLELARDDAGHPRLALDGNRVDTVALSAAQHKRLVELMVMLRPFVEAGSRSEETAAGETNAAAVAGVSPSSFTSGTLPERAPSALPGRSAVMPAVMAAPVAGPATAAPTSLVTQIDAILQARLAGTPLAARGIRLAEALNGGAIVFVGTDHFDGVADVPDAEVRAAIHAAIAEWEKRYTPG